MSDRGAILFLSRWKGTIGPNIWLAQVAAEAQRRGHRVHVASPWRDEATDALAARGASVYVVKDLDWIPRGFNPLKHLSYLLASRRAIRELEALIRDVDAAVICLNGLNMPYVPCVGGRTGRPVVAVMHGTRLPSSQLAGRLFFATQQPFVTRYLVVTQGARSLLVGHGVPDEKVAVIPNGVDTTVFAPRPPDEALAASLGLDPRRPILAAVTHLTPRKGVALLIEAAAKLVPRCPQVQCLIVGTTTDPTDEPYAAQLRRRVSELQLERHVLLAGYQRNVPGIWSLATLAVHPSQTEACPYGVLEAQACGRAVVGFHVGGMGEIVDDGSTGVLVPPFDTDALAEAVVELLKNPRRRDSLGRAARERAVGRFDVARNVARVVDLLSDPNGYAPDGTA